MTTINSSNLKSSFRIPGKISVKGKNIIPSSGIPISELYPNRPSDWTNSTELDFSQSIPSGGTGVDVAIPGTDWFVINLESNWTKVSDATAPQSPPDIWRGHVDSGVYGDGHGIGNVFTYAMLNQTRLYASLRCRWAFPNDNWHPISNKFINIFSNHSTILVQSREGGNWRHCEELGQGDPYWNFYVDDGTDNLPFEDHIAGQLDNRAIPTNQWVQIEVVIDLPNHVFKVWQDGVLTTSATPTFSSTAMESFGVFSHRGGGGETLADDIDFEYDHFFLAW